MGRLVHSFQVPFQDSVQFESGIFLSIARFHGLKVGLQYFINWARSLRINGWSIRAAYSLVHPV